MTEPVKSRRAYDASLRHQQARATQSHVVEVAHRLFVQRGYVATTVREVARTAGVSAQTIYAGFGTKAGLFTRVFDVAIVGDDEPVPLAEREPYRRTMTAATFDEALEAYAVACRTTFSGYAQLYPVLLAAAAVEAELAAYHHTNLIENRRGGQRRLAEHLHARGWVGVDVDEAADAIWALGSPDLYVALTEQRGWSGERYEGFLVRMLRAALA